MLLNERNDTFVGGGGWGGMVNDIFRVTFQRKRSGLSHHSNCPLKQKLSFVPVTVISKLTSSIIRVEPW